MQVPKRKNETHGHVPTDTYMTQGKLNELKDQLTHLKKVSLPRATKELTRLAEMGDRSENAAYSIAKGKLRGMQQRAEDLEQLIKTAIVITPKTNADHIEVGSRITIEIQGKQHTYQILGSSETRPEAGIISHVSPLGAALIGKRVGDTVNVKLNADKKINVTIIAIK